MHKLYFQCLILLSLFTSSQALAQSGFINGKVIDEKGAPLAYANVILLIATDSVSKTGTVTSADGSFKIATPAAGKYRLLVKSVGYFEQKTDVFEVTGTGFTQDFGSITLKQNSKLLKDVNITASRPTIVQKEDRIEVNIEGTALAAGNTAYSVLSNVPGVFADQEGNIQLNGRAGVTVMLDGKLTYLSARDLRTMLEGMSAENIKNIEIITNPSAKYDAEGSAGILNINLKKNTQTGLNGSFYAGNNYNGKQYGYSGGGNINYKAGKWNSFVNADMARRVGGREATFTRIFFAPQQNTYFDQTALGNYGVYTPSVRLGSDYSFNKSHSIGFIGNFAHQTGTNDFLTNTFLGNAPGKPNQNVIANNYASNRFTNFSSNLHYLGKLDTTGMQISSDLDYVHITNYSTSDFFNFYNDLTGTQPTRQDFLFTEIPSGYDIYAAKVDFTYPTVKAGKFETGLKGSRVTSDNDSRFFFNNNGLVLDPLRTNHFIYTENIYAAYINWSGKLSQKVTLQSGLRAEGTQSTGESLTTGQVTDRKYLNLFPSLFLQHKISANYQVNYNYSRRIQRPNYGSLNPFIFYRDPYTYVQGNPFLRPQYANSFGITQTFLKTYILTLQYQRLKDVISELPILDVANATTIYTTGNVNNAYNYGLTAIAPVKIMKKWETNNTLILQYDNFSTLVNNGQQAVNKQLFFMLQSNQTIQLPWKTRFEVNGVYRGPGASGLYYIKAFGWVNMGLKKSFMKDKLDLNLSVNDIFKTYRLRFTTDIGGNVNEFDQYLRNRYASFTVRYRFSKGQKLEVQQNKSLDELKRTGN